MMAIEGDQQSFWEHRLAVDWTERGVGYSALGRQFNSWVYRVRTDVFLREAATLGLGSDDRVLDVGSGTGVYVCCWKRLGAGDIVASDLTAAAVQQLRGQHPDIDVVRADVTRPEQISRLGPFDAVSCVDVLFHITGDDAYLAAVHNLAKVVRSGGHLILSENFLRRGPDVGRHQVSRTEGWITSALEQAGFEVERRVPMLVLMNAQVDAPAPWRKLWGGALRAVTVTPPTGWLAGAALYPLERQLVRRLSRTPTTELVICRRD